MKHHSACKFYPKALNTPFALKCLKTSHHLYICALQNMSTNPTEPIGAILWSEKFRSVHNELHFFSQLYTTK